MLPARSKKLSVKLYPAYSVKSKGKFFLEILNHFVESLKHSAKREHKSVKKIIAEKKEAAMKKTLLSHLKKHVEKTRLLKAALKAHISKSHTLKAAAVKANKK